MEFSGKEEKIEWKYFSQEIEASKYPRKKKNEEKKTKFVCLIFLVDKSMDFIQTTIFELKLII